MSTCMRRPNQRRGEQDPALGNDIESMATAERAAADRAVADKNAAPETAAARLHLLFPEISEETLIAVLFQCGYDEDAAVSVLLSMNEAPVRSAAPPASTPAPKKAAAEKAAAEKKAAADKAAAEKTAAAEKAAAEKAAAEKKAAAERAAAEKAAAERLVAERLAAERAAAERAEDKLSHWRMEMDKMSNARAELCKAQDRVRLLAAVVTNEDESLRDATKVRDEARATLVRVLDDALSAHHKGEVQRRSLTAEAAALQQQQQQGECALTLAEQVWLIGPDGILWALIGSDCL